MSIRLASHRQSTDEGGRLRIERAWYVDTEIEIDLCAAENTVYRGIPKATYTADNWSEDTVDAGFRVTIIYEGRDLTANGPNAPERARWRLNPSFEKEPIESHPAIDEIIAFYDGKIDPETKRVTFPEVYARGINAAGPSKSNHWQGSGQGGAANLEKNPLYGIDESGYLALAATATCRYTTNSIANAMERVGEVFETLPYNAPSDFNLEGRDWLKAPPDIEELGEGEDGRNYAVEERYLLSKPGGWPPTVYDFIEA